MILLSTTLLIQIEQFLTEKRMLIETETILKQDYYQLSTIDLLQTELSTNENIQMGSLDFKDGQADYSIKELSDGLLELKVILKTGINKITTIEGTAIYDKNLKKIIKWTEIN